MKNKLYQPMDPKDAINYIYDNQYDSPRKLIYQCCRSGQVLL